MIRRNPEHRGICRRFLDRLDIVQDDQDWPAAEDFEQRFLPENADELVNVLAEEVGEEPLIDSGIAALDGEGSLTASLRLASSGAILIPIFQAADRLPVDVLLSDGLLLGGEAPAYVAVHDYRLAAAMRSSSRVLLVVPTIDDVVTCQALGLAAVPVAGMDCLNLIGLRQLEELTSTPNQLLLPETIEQPVEGERSSAVAVSSSGVRNPEMCESAAVQHTAPDHDTAEDAPSDDGFDVIDLSSDDLLPVDIIIVGWSFALHQRVPGEQLQRVVARLANAQRFVSIDLSGVGVWIPEAGDVEKILFCWELRDRDAVRNTVLKSIRSACYSLSAAMSGEIAAWQTPDTYLEARSALWRSLRNTAEVPAGRGALIEKFEDLLQRQTIDPLMEAGVNDPDPACGALRMELANTSSLLQLQAPFLQHDLSQASIQAESRDKRGTLERSIRTRMQLIDRLVRIVRELRR